MMRTIAYCDVVDAVRELCGTVCHDLNEEMRTAFEAARATESNEGSRALLEQLLENADIAQSERLPLCQDTGVAVVYADQGNRCYVAPPEDRPDATLDDAINEGVQQGYEAALLRKSMVAEPLHERVNTRTNTPSVIHHAWTAGEQLRLTLMAKGGGCENKSVFKMFKPTVSAEEVKQFVVDTIAQTGADACPPFVVGVGIGGTFEKCCDLAKRALLRPLDSRHDDDFYAEMECDLLARANALRVGPAGLGGDTTALAVLIETFACHIASLPVAINIECHSHRHKSVVL